jgi:anti-sigma factor RsiW
MIHVDEGTLLAHVDGQSDARREEVAGHLAACPQCAAELRSLRDMTAELHGALMLTDVAVPVAAARTRLIGELSRVREAEWRGVRLGPFRVGVLQAAMLALVLAGVVGAAIPGTPLRLWVESVIAAVTGTQAEPALVPPMDAVPPVPAPPVVAAGEDEHGVRAEDGRVRIVLHDPPADARIVVALGDGDRATLRATARFTTTAGRLEASAIGAGEIRVTLPRSGVTGTVELDGRVLVERAAGVYTFLAPGATQDGDIVVVRIPR